MDTSKLSSRRLLALTLFAASALASHAQALELRGFRGVAWGTSAKRLGASHLVYSDGEVRCYRRPHENMWFGESPVKDVRFCFHQDQLFLVALDAEADIAALARDFASTYGPPDVRLPTQQSWGQRSGLARVEMMASAAGGTTLLIHSNEFEPATQRAASAE